MTRKARKLKSLPRRPDSKLNIVSDQAGVISGPTLLDTCVYIDILQGRAPEVVRSHLLRASSYHSTIALAEMTYTIGRLDPSDSRSIIAIAAISALLDSIPDSRISSPSPSAMAAGGVRSGAATRLLGHAEHSMSNDAYIAAQAAEQSLTVVTRNISDFDRLSQMDPSLSVAYYRT